MEGKIIQLQAILHYEESSVPWHNCLWFSCATPKYQFCTWLALHDRFSTGARMAIWNRTIDGSCVLCHQHMETRDHIFFSCPYSAAVWGRLSWNLMGSHFSTNWNDIVIFVSQKKLDRVELFLTCYVLHTTIYAIWRERNARKHGYASIQSEVLFRTIDRLVKNRSLNSPHDKRFTTTFQVWIGAVN